MFADFWQLRSILNVPRLKIYSQLPSLVCIPLVSLCEILTRLISLLLIDY